MSGRCRMKYFILKQDERYKSIPIIKGIPKEIIDPRDLYKKNYHLMPKVTRLETYNSEPINFIDIITNPILMLTEKAIDIVKIYMPKLTTRDISIIDKIGGRTQTYQIPLIPKIECLTKSNILKENRGKIEKLQLDKKRIKHQPLFYIAELKEDLVVIRLDMLESMLKRKIRGIQIQEVEVKNDFNEDSPQPEDKK